MKNDIFGGYESSGARDDRLVEIYGDKKLEAVEEFLKAQKREQAQMEREEKEHAALMKKLNAAKKG